MRLSEIMERRVETVGPELPADDAWNIMRLQRIRHLVVVRGGHVMGVLSDRDLGGTKGSAVRLKHTVEELMTGHVVAATPRTTVREAANLMRGRTIGCLPVLDRGRLAGIVTVSDLLELIGRGTERPIPKTKRWTLRHRGQRPRQARA
jgi:acetoin utilization protein AcuB